MADDTVHPRAAFSTIVDNQPQDLTLVTCFVSEASPHLTQTLLDPAIDALQSSVVCSFYDINFLSVRLHGTTTTEVVLHFVCAVNLSSF